MTSVSNVRVIVNKMLDYLRTTVDDYMRSDLVGRVTQLAEKFAPDNAWFVRTMAAVFELGGGLVRPEAADSLMRLIAEGARAAAAKQADEPRSVLHPSPHSSHHGNKGSTLRAARPCPSLAGARQARTMPSRTASYAPAQSTST